MGESGKIFTQDCSESVNVDPDEGFWIALGASIGQRENEKNIIQRKQLGDTCSHVDDGQLGCVHRNLPKSRYAQLHNMAAALCYKLVHSLPASHIKPGPQFRQPKCYSVEKYRV